MLGEITNIDRNMRVMPFFGIWHSLLYVCRFHSHFHKYFGLIYTSITYLKHNPQNIVELIQPGLIVENQDGMRHWI